MRNMSCRKYAGVFSIWWNGLSVDSTLTPASVRDINTTRHVGWSVLISKWFIDWLTDMNGYLLTHIHVGLYGVCLRTKRYTVPTCVQAKLHMQPGIGNPFTESICTDISLDLINMPACTHRHLFYCVHCIYLYQMLLTPQSGICHWHHKSMNPSGSSP